tara:strand:+ start:675 stop:1895 length:1221 start_codon:yes stop_codon:yes gene_type:complete
MKMDEIIMKEITKAAEVLDMSQDDVLAKFNDICTQNNIDMAKEELLARGLFRQWFTSVKTMQKKAPTTTTGGFFKNAFGFFVALDEARDMMEMSRTRITNEYRRDAEVTYNLGKVAVCTVVENGVEIRMMRKGEEVIKVLSSLPTNHVELDNGQFIVPIDTTEMYGTTPNTNFNKPLPKSEFRRSGVFIGEVDGVMGKYFFNYKGVHTKDFNPKTFEFVHFICILNSRDATKIHGATDKTLASLMYNSDLDDADEKKINVSVNMQDELMARSENNYCALIDLDRYHSSVTEKVYADRFVFTDGTVSSVNLNATANGNRIVNVTDLNADFDYSDGFNNGTTCWIPAHMNIDFGIGSQITIVGRTSQGTDEDGNLRPISINVNGLLVMDKRGGDVSHEEVVEDNLDWF